MSIFLKSIIIFSACLFSGCAMWSPGNDPNGKVLVASANQVLVALAAFYKKYNQYPQSLNQLSPEFIASLPATPALTYQSANGSISFIYSPSWPQSGQVSCSGNAAQVQLNCHGYY